MQRLFKNKAWVLLILIALAFVMIAGCSNNSENASNSPAEVQIVDMAGRTVTIPGSDYLNKVFFSSPIGMIMTYSMDPDKMAGTSMELSDAELAYMAESVSELPYLGGIQSGAEMNKEAIVNSGAQVFFSVGPGKINESTVADADKLQEQLNIPVVVLDGNIENAAATYELMGKIFGQEEKAAELGAYCTNVFTDVVEKVSTIPEEDRVSVYYAEGPDGLSTEPSSSAHAAVIKYANAKNVADDVEVKAGSGMSPVSLEQVLAWNPDVIICWSDARGGAYSKIMSDENWAKLDAVKNGRVYVMPSLPFSWMDRPPSVNRFLGIQWLANLLYPNVYDIEINEVTKDFFKLFYNIEVNDDQVTEILQNSVAAK